MSLCPDDYLCVRDSLWQTTGANAHVFGGLAAILVPVVIFRACYHPKYILAVVSTLFLVYVLV